MSKIKISKGRVIIQDPPGSEIYTTYSLGGRTRVALETNTDGHAYLSVTSYDLAASFIGLDLYGFEETRIPSFLDYIIECCSRKGIAGMSTQALQQFVDDWRNQNALQAAGLLSR